MAESFFIFRNCSQPGLERCEGTGVKRSGIPLDQLDQPYDKTGNLCLKKTLRIEML